MINIELLKKINSLKEKVDDIYIYGVGSYGKNLYQALKSEVDIAGFAVTHNQGIGEYEHKKIVEADTILEQNVGLLLAVNRVNEQAIREYLSAHHFPMDQVLYVGNDFDREGITQTDENNPCMEITTVIGCKVNCRYCPQSVLIKKYNVDRTKSAFSMGLENFKICIDKLPLNCIIRFAGMAEPFLNPACFEMLEYACATGRKVELFTTLMGADIETVEKLEELSLTWVNLHVADKNGNAWIPVDEEYLQKLQIILNMKTPKGLDFVNVISAQGEVDDRVKNICKDRFPVLSELQDRAGNISGDGIESRKTIKGKRFYCSLCGQRLDYNILLPDGTVVMCCQDYGMQHVFGNLLKQSYEEIQSSMEKDNVKLVMDGKRNQEILCHECAFANEY